ncbi:hypothetical protein [Kitasatospora sp. NBC_01302]|uniref:hypothetical protein n=1 Tax=Kitasatospora sp. NBC_01302 TaxID=2903575 RepID=UPI002E0DF2BF|nr:hypothetical protein OG294_39755 [Kitasatospora sp. NBC_01302]
MHTTELAGGWLVTIAGLGTDAKFVIFTILIPAMCGLFVVVVGMRTRSPGPTIMAVIMAAIVWGLSSSMGTLQGKAVQDITTHDNGSLTSSTTSGTVQRGDQ